MIANFNSPGPSECEGQWPFSLYDAFSRRVLKVTPTKTHTFLYDGWNVVREVVRNTATGFVTDSFDYYWGRDLSGSLQGAGGVGGLVAYTRSGSLRIPVYDHIGNVVAVVDDSGTVLAAYEYDPFGNVIAQSGAEADEVPFRFSTKYFDPETGLYYYGYRFYAPLLGRWINRDPIGETGGENLYSFCDNCPECLFDFYGLSNPATWEEIATAIISLFMNWIADDVIISGYYGGKAAFIAETASHLFEKGPLSGLMWNRAVSFGRGKGYSAPALTITENNQGEWGNVVNQIKASPEYGQKTRFIKDRLKTGTSSRGFLNIEFNTTTDLAYSIHGAQLHYNKMDDCVMFTVLDDYNFDRKHMWRKLQDDGDIAPYPVIILLPIEKID